MKIEGYTQISFATWRKCKHQTLHVIKQCTEENGCRTNEVLYFIKSEKCQKLYGGERMNFNDDKIVDVYECGCGIIWKTDSFAEDCCDDEDYSIQKGWYCYCDFEKGLALLKNEKCPFCCKRFAEDKEKEE